MAINFPSNPVDGASFSAGGNTFIYDSFADRWRAYDDFYAVGGTAELSGDTDVIYDSGGADTAVLTILDGGSA
jgi:hypothetical protein